jgi:hypothetical protein
MSSTLFSRGVTSQMGSKARADRIDADIHNLKVAAGEILALKRTVEAQAAQIAALESTKQSLENRLAAIEATLQRGNPISI